MSVSEKESNHFNCHCESKTKTQRAFLLTEREIQFNHERENLQSLDDLFSSAAGIFLSFERLVYFTVSKQCIKFSTL